MIAAELLAECDRRGVRLRVEGGRLRYRGPADAFPEPFLAALRANRVAVLGLLIAPGSPTAGPRLGGAVAAHIECARAHGGPLPCAAASPDHESQSDAVAHMAHTWAPRHSAQMARASRDPVGVGTASIPSPACAIPARDDMSAGCAPVRRTRQPGQAPDGLPFDLDVLETDLGAIAEGFTLADDRDRAEAVARRMTDEEHALRDLLDVLGCTEVDPGEVDGPSVEALASRPPSSPGHDAGVNPTMTPLGVEQPASGAGS